MIDIFIVIIFNTNIFFSLQYGSNKIDYHSFFFSLSLLIFPLLSSFLLHTLFFLHFYIGFYHIYYLFLSDDNILNKTLICMMYCTLQIRITTSMKMVTVFVSILWSKDFRLYIQLELRVSNRVIVPRTVRNVASISII